jgi:D-xylose ABC transporter substrate-binding protein
VVIPYDGEKAAAIVELAHKNGAKVLSYDRLIKNSPVDFYVSFDNVKVGELEANGVLSKVQSGNIAYIGGAPTDNNATLLKKGSHSLIDPRVKDGSIKLVIDEFTPDWRPDDAYLTVKKFLQSGKTLSGVIAANDGTAGGAVRALKEVGLSGKIPVSGQDAEVAACQRIIEGTQTMTVYKPISAIAKKAAEIAINMAEGVSPVSNSTVENGTYTTTSYLIEPIAVDRSNMDTTIIKDGYHTREQIYGK